MLDQYLQHIYELGKNVTSTKEMGTFTTFCVVNKTNTLFLRGTCTSICRVLLAISLKPMAPLYH